MHKKQKRGFLRAALFLAGCGLFCGAISAKSERKKVAAKPEVVKKEVKKREQPLTNKVVNEIAVLIYTNVPSQTSSDSKEFERAPDVVITRLDIDRPSIDGKRRTLDEQIMDQLMYCEATYFYRMLIPDDAVDKYLNAIKEQHHLTDDQLRAMLKEVGYTMAEARVQLAMGQAIDSLINFKIRSRLVVLEKDARIYYEAHPEYEEASYRIRKAFIPESLFTEEEMAHLSDAMLKNPAVEWTTSYWLNEDEMTDFRKEILRALKQNEYSKPEVVTGGYEVIQVLTIKPRALRSFEDRYREISMLLQEPQYYRLLDELKKELLDKYEIVYFK